MTCPPGVLLLLIALPLLLTGPAAAETVIHSIPAPNYAAGLAWDGSALWCGIYGPSGTPVYRLDPADGAVLDSFVGPGTDTYGLSWDGSALWQLDAYNFDALYRLDTDGNILDQIPSITTYMAGLAWDGTWLWEAAYYNPDGWIYQVDPATGAAVHSFAAPAHQPWGLAWDGSRLWCVNDDFGGEEAIIYLLDPADGSIIKQFPSPAANPRGLEWDGTYLWVCADNNAGAGRRCYQIDPGGGGTPDIALSATAHDYGINPTGVPAAWTLTITNAGTADLTISAIASDDPHFTPESMSFPQVITAEAALPVEIEFLAATPGVFQGTLTISSDDPDESSVTVDLDGTAVVPQPDIQVSALDHDFGPTRVNGRNRWILEITNRGFADLVLSGVEVLNLVDPEAYSIRKYGPPPVISTFEVFQLQVDFTPPATGEYPGGLTLLSNDPNAPALPIGLSGRAKSHQVAGGGLLWWFQGIENVECLAAIPDVTGDGIPDAVVESYDAGAPTGEPHLSLIWGNSDSGGRGVVHWAVHPTYGASSGGGYGDRCLDVSPDTDGDGYSEVLLGTAWGGRSFLCIDGEDGNVKWIYDTYLEDGEGGWCYAVSPMPDVGGDGVPEALGGAGGHDGGTAGPRSAYCFDGTSSTTGDIVWRRQANDAILDLVEIGDVNADGVPDVAAGAGGNFTQDNHVYCLSGASSGSATTFWVYDTGGDNPSVSRHSDINGDGVSEVVVGSWQNGYAGGAVFCLDGSGAPAPLWTWPLSFPVMRVDSFGDTTGDGIKEVAVASWAPWVYCLDGATGAMLWLNYRGSDVWAVSGIPDVNRDGVWDVLAGAFTGVVACLSGKDGSEIWSYDTGSKIFTLRWTADVNGDGMPDALAGTQMLDTGGRAYCLSGGTGLSPHRSFAAVAEREPEGVRLVVTTAEGCSVGAIHVYRREVDPAAVAQGEYGTVAPAGFEPEGKASATSAPAGTGTADTAAGFTGDGTADFRAALDGRAPDLPAGLAALPPRIQLLEERRARLTARLDGFRRINAAPVAGKAFTDATACPGIAYEYVIAALTEDGDEIFSERIEVTEAAGETR